LAGLRLTVGPAYRATDATTFYSTFAYDIIIPRSWQPNLI
jgi:hypothetical protein